MAPIYGIQPTFAGGEFSPSLWSRVDLQKYSMGLKTAKNFFIHPHGGASNRPGLRYIASTKYSTAGGAYSARLVPFIFSSSQAYILEFGDQYIRFYTNGGQIMNGGSPYEVTTSWPGASYKNLKFAQSADTLYICSEYKRPQTLVRYSDTNWVLSDYAFNDGPFMLDNTDSTKKLNTSVTTGSGTMTATGHTPFQSVHVNSLWKISHEISASHDSATVTTSGVRTGIKCGSTWRLNTSNTWSGSFKIQKSLDAGSNWIDVRVCSSYNPTLEANGKGSNFNLSGTVEEPCLMRINVTSLAASSNLTYDFNTDPFIQHGVVKVTGYTSPSVVSITVIKEVGETTTTTDWAEGSWSYVRGWPTVVTFYQDRLVWGSTSSEPQTSWMTETGNYNSFLRSDPLVDSDGITVNIPSRKMNAIKNLLNLGDIVALTSSNEASISAATDGVISPTNISTKIHGYRGSSSVDPVIVGNKAIYVQPMGSVVRDIGYDYSSNSWTGENITVMSNHFFKGKQIVDLAYQQEPDSIVWAVRNDGKFLSLTYLKEQEVNAWTQHSTNGTVESVASIPGTTHDEIWMVVKRSNGRFVERMDERLASTDPFLQFYVDNGISLSPTKVSITNVVSFSYSGKNYVRVYKTSHGLSQGQKLDFYDLTGLSINKMQYTVDWVNGNNANYFDLKNGVNFVEWTTGEVYAGGGSYAIPSTTISGLSHLNGTTVSVLGNGNVYKNISVSGGSLTLPDAVSTAQIGLSYECDLETLNVELGLKDGTTQGRKVHVAQVPMRFIDSRGGWIGPDENSLREIVQRTNEPLGSALSLFSGDVVETISSSFDSGGRIFYRQSDPLPVTILSFMPVVEVGG